jgi:hypothetical protein
MSSVPPSRSMAARLRWPAAALLLAVAGGHWAAWRYATGRIMADMPVVLANAAAFGWTIETGPPQRAGWPWAAVVRLPHGVASTAALRWTTEWIDVAIVPRDPGALQVSPSGAQTIQTPGAAPLPFSARQATLRVPLAGDEPLTLDVRDLDGGGIRTGRLEATLAPLDASIAASSIELAQRLPDPFSGGIAVMAHLALTRPVSAGATPAAAAAQWRAAGGEARITEFNLRWGPLEASGNGSLRLDAALQPQAEARVEMTGAGALVDAAAEAGLLAAGPASAARAVLGVLTVAAKGGPLGVPVSLRDRVLTVAQFPLLKLPPMNWGRP